MIQTKYFVSLYLCIPLALVTPVKTVVERFRMSQLSSRSPLGVLFPRLANIHNAAPPLQKAE